MGFVIKYSPMSLIEKCFTFKLYLSIWYAIKKYLIFKFMVLFLELLFPFFSKISSLLLSFIIVFSLTSNNLAFKNNLVHKIIIIASSVATKSASVQLLVLYCLFLYIKITANFHIVIVVPVWLLKYGCIENSTSTYHLMILVLSSDRFKQIYFILLKHFISLVIFLRLSHLDYSLCCTRLKL